MSDHARRISISALVEAPGAQAQLTPADVTPPFLSSQSLVSHGAQEAEDSRSYHNQQAHHARPLHIAQAHQTSEQQQEYPLSNYSVEMSPRPPPSTAFNHSAGNRGGDYAYPPPSATPAMVGGLRMHPVPQLQGAVSKGRRGKKHRCEHPGCGREFTRKSNLEAHSRKHMTGDRATPYACTHCGRKFKWRSSLKSHESGCMHQPPILSFQRQGALAAAAMGVGQAARVPISLSVSEGSSARESSFNGVGVGQRSSIASSDIMCPSAYLYRPPRGGAPTYGPDYPSGYIPAAAQSAEHSFTNGATSWSASAGTGSNASSRQVVQAMQMIPPAVSRPETHGMLSSLRLPMPGALNDSEQ